MTTESDLSSERDDFVAYVRRQVVGPFGTPTEVIEDPPNRRYLMGILFPQGVDQDGHVEAEGEQGEDGAETAAGFDSLFSDDPVAAANEFLPSSIGVSFYTTASEVSVDVRAGRYATLAGDNARLALESVDRVLPPHPTDHETDGKVRKAGRVWRREPLATLGTPVSKTDSISVLDGRADLRVRWRPAAGGALVTVTVVNSKHAATADEKVDRLWDDMLLQTEIVVACAAPSEFVEYPSIAALATDPEEAELRIQYGDAKTYVVGHGCAVSWSSDGEPVQALTSNVMPEWTVPMVTADPPRREGGAPWTTLDIAWLANEETPVSTVVSEMSALVDAYEHWATALKSRIDQLPGARGAAERIVDRIDTAVARIRKGIVLLRDDGTTLEAFRLANRAMLMQMRHSRPDLAGARRSRNEAVRDLPAAYEPGPTWRPFQLAFALLTLPTLVNRRDEYRETVDLIWFPTGGGKTEAYLLVALFEIFRRRLAEGARGGGTCVISRYTLTLLTTQQFQRTATTMCAGEMVRRAAGGRLGDEPVSIGLYVGEMTPNSYSKAAGVVQDLRDANRPENKLVLERCPWCGTEILPRELDEDELAYGVRATDTSFRFHCTNDACPFHESLPVHVVDPDLYEHRPSFVVGTVDKFAGLVWDWEPGVLLGVGGDRLPPSLILQDELHLLTGPLGTTVGLYERAIERLCQVDGIGPKIIASTATIRRAGEQIEGLFGRPVRLFPPSGLDADDSFFARPDTGRPGRLFVGLMAQGHTADTATVQTLTALLQAPLDLGLTGEARDAWWTLVAYHSSLRELGRTVTIARDDVTARLEAMMSGRKWRDFGVEELSSNIDRSSQTALLERLALAETDSRHVGLLVATNMLSVGVDVPRLGLMLVNGQPKATSEYIQATSRVGRGAHPGLVFSMFRSTRPRDRSHYELFQSYHSSLYQHVEPTSVTPFSPPSRRRALHAALIILVRHAVGLSRDAQASEIANHLPAVMAHVEALVESVRALEPREARAAERELNAFVESWKVDAAEADRQNKVLYYRPAGKGQYNLLKYFGSSGVGTPTLTSMRNVDRTTMVDVWAPTSTTPRGKK